MSRLPVLVLLLHAYIGARLLPDLGFGMPGVVVGAAVLAASALLIPVGMRARRFASGRRSNRLMWIGLVAVGAFSTLLVLTIARDVALAGALVVDRWWGPASIDALSRWSARAVPIVTAFLTAVGYRNARRIPAVRTIEVPIAMLHPALQGFTIAQISDMHIGPTIRRAYVDAVVDVVNGIDADLVAITGDLVDGSVRQLAQHTAPLARIFARHGTYFVTGNHEYYSGAPAWIDELRRIGMHVLLNEHVVLDHDGAALVVAGVTDHSSHHFVATQRSDPSAAIAGAPEASAKVLLAHQPRSAFSAERAGFDLQLSGHTHGGQFLPWNFFVRFQQPFTAGLARLGALWVYTSRGTGYWGPPKRLGAPSEITRIRLIAA